MRFRSFLGIVILCSMAIGCQTWDDFTTIFNTYYNAKRLMLEIEDEFEFLDEKKRVKPRVFVPERSTLIEDVFASFSSETPQFLKEFIISPQKLQPVKIKVDSVLIKGSKILANHPKSSKVPGALFLMAKAHFYKSDWLSTQVKCQELMDGYPYSEWAPETHLFLAKSLLLQKKWGLGERALSQAVDIAWGQDNFDVLSEAFRLQAALALHHNNVDDALKPYRRAIAQSRDDEQRAKWQVEIGAILFNLNEFEAAAYEFSQVDNFTPDILAEFESQLYLGASLAWLEEFEEAESIFDELERNSNYEEWQANVFAERMNLLRLQEREDELKDMERIADSAYVGNGAVAAFWFQRGVDFFLQGKYSTAQEYFAQSKVIRSPVYQEAGRYHTLLSSWEQRSIFALPLAQSIMRKNEGTDSLRVTVASSLFELGRIHEQMSNADSAYHYYFQAVEICPPKYDDRARYLYALARITETYDVTDAERIMIDIAKTYPFTEYGTEARYQTGYTNAIAVDTIAELYASGYRYQINANDREFAVRQFSKLAHRYPESALAPRALYNAGWIFERDIRDNDSALHYYKWLVDKYPKTDYAEDVEPSVKYALGVRNGSITPDTLDLEKNDPSDKKSEKGRLLRNFSNDAPSTDTQRPSLKDLVDPSRININSPDVNINVGGKKIDELIDTKNLPSLKNISPWGGDDKDEEEESKDEEKKEEKKKEEAKKEEGKKKDSKQDNKNDAKKEDENNDNEDKNKQEKATKLNEKTPAKDSVQSSSPKPVAPENEDPPKESENDSKKKP